MQEGNLLTSLKIYEDRIEDLKTQVQYFKKLYEDEKLEKLKIFEKIING